MKLKELKDRIRARKVFDDEAVAQMARQTTPPRYDSVFAEGMAASTGGERPALRSLFNSIRRLEGALNRSSGADRFARREIERCTLVRDMSKLLEEFGCLEAAKVVADSQVQFYCCPCCGEESPLGNTSPKLCADCQTALG